MKGKALATTLLVAISLSVAARAQTLAKEALVEEHLARAAARLTVRFHSRDNQGKGEDDNP